jgi:hypothetical protein
MRKSGISPGKNGGRNDSPTEVEQRCIIKFLHLKGLKLGDTVVELATLYGEDAYTRPSINYWLHQLKLGRTDLTTQHVGGRPYLDDTDAEILSVLRISPFSSVRTIADSLAIPASTMYLHLVEKIAFKNYFLRWVEHMLTDELRQKRVELSRQLLELLESQRGVNFRDIVTWDESWFLRHSEHERNWCLSADEIPTKVRPTIGVRKTMLTVFLSVRGAVLITWLPHQAKFNSTYFCQNLLQQLAHILHSGRNTHSGRPRVHFDNATPHRSARSENCFQACGFHHAPEPPYSHDISPCDFFLFGDLKMKLKGEEFETLEEFQEWVEELLGLINSELMERVYEHWIERLNQLIDTNGDYV